MAVLVFKLLCVLMQSKVFRMMNTVFLENEDCELEQLSPEAVFLLDTEDTEQGQEEEVLVDQMALADTFMVSWPCFSHVKAKVSTSYTVYSA